MPEGSFLQRLLTRPLVLFRFALVAGGVLMLVIALVVLLGGGPAVTVLGRGAAGQSLSASAAGTAEVFADVEQTGDTTCEVDGSRADSLTQLPGGPVEVDGATWYPTANKVSVTAGASVVCEADGASEVLLAERSGRERVLKATLFAVAGVGGLLLGLGGLLLARARRSGR
ncbi:hypothetical protein H9L10_13505 [Phycicoccus endophyticus]|uniref:Uncharacterized protein n=1 Tax=Phycicoccus endophyticus TaxID=1690220 RepID=A0A7G9R0U9_9MICO|nr:hypothetical protein [Phycicoccus endophyticus]NHI19515.1 hypothetical protein [Phycicoccus endophyticus]QNN49224.1 hypothetical protein H9L10_13505 [Phycicoccus endophyticus]GGL39790.1 hypothetical protein GCM10012283_22860 [Phycicoccus endophyticus]